MGAEIVIQLKWATILIALFLAGLAAHREWLSRKKFNHDKYLAKEKRKAELFDRRYAVYVACRRALKVYYSESRFPTDYYYELLDETKGARYILPPNVYQVVDDLITHVFNLNHYKMICADGNMEHEWDDYKRKLKDTQQSLQSLADGKTLNEAFDEVLVFKES